MAITFQPGVCKACQLPPSDLVELAAWRARHSRMRRGVLRVLGISRWSWFRHHHNRCKGRFPYWQPEEWQRRRAQGKRIARWKPGQSGGGNRKGHPDKRPRRKPQGIFAAIRAERAERAAKLESQRQAAILEREARLERVMPPSKAFF